MIKYSLFQRLPQVHKRWVQNLPVKRLFLQNYEFKYSITLKNLCGFLVCFLFFLATSSHWINDLWMKSIIAKEIKTLRKWSFSQSDRDTFLSKFYHILYILGNFLQHLHSITQNLLYIWTNRKSEISLSILSMLRKQCGLWKSWKNRVNQWQLPCA